MYIYNYKYIYIYIYVYTHIYIYICANQRTNTDDPMVFGTISARLYKASCNQLAKAFGAWGYPKLAGK